MCPTTRINFWQALPDIPFIRFLGQHDGYVGFRPSSPINYQRFIIDMCANTQIHLDDMLDRFVTGEYHTLTDVIHHLETVGADFIVCGDQIEPLCNELRAYSSFGRLMYLPF